VAPEAEFRRVLWALTCGRHHGLVTCGRWWSKLAWNNVSTTKRTMKTTCSRAKVLTAVTAMMLAGLLAGCDAVANALEVIEAAPGVAADAPAPAGDAAHALVQLESIPVKGRAPKTGYTRDEFGPAWADVDRNGCDTRNDILARDLTTRRSSPAPTTVWSPPAPGRQVHRHYHQLRRAARTRAPTSRSTTSSRSATPGRRAHSSSATTSARNSPTTP
jgi:hypothetical protein